MAFLFVSDRNTVIFKQRFIVMKTVLTVSERANKSDYWKIVSNYTRQNNEHTRKKSANLFFKFAIFCHELKLLIMKFISTIIYVNIPWNYCQCLLKINDLVCVSDIITVICKQRFTVMLTVLTVERADRIVILIDS